MAKNSYGWASPSSGSGNFSQGQGKTNDFAGMGSSMPKMPPQQELPNFGSSMPQRGQAPSRDYGTRATLQGPDTMQGGAMSDNSRASRRPAMSDRGAAAFDMPGMMDNSNASADRDRMAGIAAMSGSHQTFVNGQGNGQASQSFGQQGASGGNQQAQGQGQGQSMQAMGNAPFMPQRTVQQRNFSDYGSGGYGNLGGAFSDGGAYTFNPTQNWQPVQNPLTANNQSGPQTGQQTPVMQQNQRVDGRWNPQMGGSSASPAMPASAPRSGAPSQPVSQPRPGAPAPTQTAMGGGGVRGGGIGTTAGGGMMAGETVAPGRVQRTAGSTQTTAAPQGMGAQGAPVGGANTNQSSAPSNFDINQLLSLFQPGGRFAPDQLGQGDRAPEMQYFANSMTPFMNFIGQGEDRDLNREQFNATLQRQIINDAHAMGIDTRGMDLQELAFKTGTEQWGRTFDEDQRRYGLDREEDIRKFDITTGYNYDRMNTENQRDRDLAQLQSDTTRRGQDVDAYGIQQRTGVDLRGQDVNLYLGDRRIDTDLYLGDREYDTRRYGIDTEAQTALARMQNDLMQSRYATFGRAQQPNFRMMGGWR